MLGKALARFDGDTTFHVWVARRANLSPEQRKRQEWRVGEHTLGVYFAADKWGLIKLWVDSGWPGKPRKSLCLAEVFAASVTGELKDRMNSPEQSRWKVRALIASGVEKPPRVLMPVLPSHAPRSAVLTWHAIGTLMQARRLRDEPPGTPLPLVAPFLARWSGVGESTLQLGKTWLKANGYIAHVGNDLKEDGSPKLKMGNPTHLWVVVEELTAAPDRDYLVIYDEFARGTST